MSTITTPAIVEALARMLAEFSDHQERPRGTWDDPPVPPSVVEAWRTALRVEARHLLEAAEVELIAAGWLSPDEVERLKAEISELRLVLDDALRHEFDEDSVLNPATGKPYPLTWGEDHQPDPLCCCGAFWSDSDGGCQSVGEELKRARARLAAVQPVIDAARALKHEGACKEECGMPVCSLVRAVVALDADSPPEGPTQ